MLTERHREIMDLLSTYKDATQRMFTALKERHRVAKVPGSETIVGRIEERIRETESEREEVIGLIERVNDPVERAILRGRYIADMTYKALAEDNHYHIRHIYKIHESALDSVDQLLRGEK
ncbi:MAG: hypothetical protein Q4Q17_01200 [Tissierellia bacterium]|nr:hypothetical protein [Tissierellia bacterium]